MQKRLEFRFLKLSLSCFLAGFLLVNISGCILAPVMDSVSKAGVTENDRRALLADSLKSFNESLYWGNLEKALKFVADEQRQDLAKEFARRKREERVVEAKTESVNYSDGAYSAEVFNVTRFYRVPVYVVTDRNETQNWEFTLTSGWKLVGRKQG